MGAAIHLTTGLMAVADDTATAMGAGGRKDMDGAFETIEIMGDAIADNLDWLVVFVAATFTAMGAWMKRILAIRRRFWFQDAGCLLFLVSFDHATTSRRTAKGVSGTTLFAWRGWNAKKFKREWRRRRLTRNTLRIKGMRRSPKHFTRWGRKTLSRPDAGSVISPLNCRCGTAFAGLQCAESTQI